MSEHTEIQWTDHTFNPWSGCAKISAGCANCYAAALPPSMRRGAEWGESGTRVEAGADYWRQPLRWQTRAARTGVAEYVFCASTADLFEDRADLDPMRARLWTLIGQTPDLVWLLLTKRPHVAQRYDAEFAAHPNAWLGVSVEDQRAAEQIPEALKVPASVRFLSCEPLLGPLDLMRWLYEPMYCRDCGRNAIWYNPNPDNLPHLPRCTIGAPIAPDGGCEECVACGGRDIAMPGALDWVIVGGESGRRARPMHPAWVRGVRDQCVEAGVPFFFKQWGEHDENGARVGKYAAGRVLDGQTWDERPGPVAP